MRVVVREGSKSRVAARLLRAESLELCVATVGSTLVRPTRGEPTGPTRFWPLGATTADGGFTSAMACRESPPERWYQAMPTRAKLTGPSWEASGPGSSKKQTLRTAPRDCLESAEQSCWG